MDYNYGEYGADQILDDEIVLDGDINMNDDLESEMEDSISEIDEETQVNILGYITAS